MKVYCIYVKDKSSSQTASDTLSVSSVLLGSYLVPQELGNIARLDRLSQGLSVLILWLGIRPCASQICPYVTKKVRVLEVISCLGCRYCRCIKHSSVLAVVTATLLGACLLL